MRHFHLGGEEKIQCEECGKAIKKSGMKIHLLKHKGTKNHRCVTCGSSWLRKADLTKHMKTEHQDVYQMCPDCNQQYTDLGRHMESHISYQTCTICGDKVRSNLMRSHMYWHDKQPEAKSGWSLVLSCKICQKVFKRKQSYEWHMLTHSDVRNYKCSMCASQFKMPASLRRHMKAVHGGNKPFSCSLCDRAFSTKINCEEHMERHKGEKQYTCTVCGLAWNCRSDQLTHMRRKHPNQQPNTLPGPGRMHKDQMLGNPL